MNPVIQYIGINNNQGCKLLNKLDPSQVQYCSTLNLILIVTISRPCPGPSGGAGGLGDRPGPRGAIETLYQSTGNPDPPLFNNSCNPPSPHLHLILLQVFIPHIESSHHVVFQNVVRAIIRFVGVEKTPNIVLEMKVGKYWLQRERGFRFCWLSLGFTQRGLSEVVLFILFHHIFALNAVAAMISIINSMLAGSTVYGGVRPNYYPWNTFLFWYALCFFIMFFPFLVCNLYYAYRDNTCVDLDPPPLANGIKMSLNQWFQVDGYIILGFIVIFFLLGVIAWCTPELACTYGWWEGLHVFFIIWRLAWLIVGSVLFWKGLRGFCGTAVRRYTFAMLIIGYIWLFVELFLAFAYPRPVPYPVSVPVATGLRTSAVIAPVGVTAGPIYRPGGIVY